MSTCIPQDDAERKRAPMFRGLLGYFPWALFKIAAHSFRSDRKHNPDKPESEAPHWRREASTDHPDCIVRHLCDAYGPRPDDFPGDDLDWEEYHLTALAWRSNALLQEFGEARRGAAPGCRSVFPTKKRLEDLLHPAQKLAIEAFKRDYNGAETPEARRAAINAFVQVRDMAPLMPRDEGKIETTIFPPRDRFTALKSPGQDDFAAGPEDFGGDEYEAP